MDKEEKAIRIFRLIRDGDIGKAKEIIKNDKSMLNFISPFGTWLHVAAIFGRMEMVKFLVESGAEININAGTPKSAPIDHAAGKGELKIVEYLLEQGAILDVSEPHRNPLFSAIYDGQFDVVKFLVEKGIDITVKYEMDYKHFMGAYEFALERGQLEIAEYLKEKLEEKNKEVLSVTTTDDNDENDPHSKILQHVSNYFGPVESTIDELIPGSSVSVSVHIFPPSENQDFFTLFTTGMSDEPMGFSSGEGEDKYAELLIKLPSNWKVDQDSMRDPNLFWPLKWLKLVAHMPHKNDGWIEEGVILPNGEPPQPFAPNTKLSCIMVTKPEEKELESVLTEQRNVKIYTLIPIYSEERDLALEKGHEYLLNRMRENGITDVLDVNRINVGIEL